jgi:multimeric flavodoxin WrbA
LEFGGITMKFVVLNGSPKGENSVTMQYIAFWQKKFPQHSFTRIDVAQRIRSIETDTEEFRKIVAQVENSDAVVWAFPVYYFLVSAQYKRFIELIFERNAEHAFRGKHAAVLSTSIHFFDHTAHNYVNAVCDDMGMNYFGGYSAEMQDLFSETEQQRILMFMRNFLTAIENREIIAPKYLPVQLAASEYVSKPASVHTDARGKKVLVVTDSKPEQTNLMRMVDRFVSSFSNQIDFVNLRELDIKGGCLGCMKCGYDNTCVYSGKDGYIDFFEKRMKPADIIIFAGAIQDRYLSSHWKAFFDRSFYNNHTPALLGKQLGFIVSGPLAQVSNLRQILEAYVEVQGANLINIITDEQEVSEQIDKQLDLLAVMGVRYAEQNFVKSPTFFAVSGHKIFRDAIWSSLRFPFVADHKYYLRHNLYDFPQNNRKTWFQSTLLYWAAKIPAVRKQLYGEKMLFYMTEPYKKIISRL